MTAVADICGPQLRSFPYFGWDPLLYLTRFPYLGCGPLLDLTRFPYFCCGPLLYLTRFPNENMWSPTGKVFFFFS
jgi:hypothetical protein